jgi:MFS superfamily sulfate permease-like transporter
MDYLGNNTLSYVSTNIDCILFLFFTGMAYGFLSQLPPIYGLYTSFFPVLLYFFFGSSRHVSIGEYTYLLVYVAFFSETI